MNERTSLEGLAANRLALGGCVLDLAAGELLTNDGQLAGLRRQALDVLLVLGGRVGQVVGKEELMQRVWPDVVVGEGSLTQAIADIRRTLGDADHRLVRNVARRGYLLVPDRIAATPRDQPARPAERAEAPDSAAPQPSHSSLPSPATPPRPSTWRRAAAALAAFIALGLAVAWLAWRPPAAPWRTPAELARAPLPRDVPPLSIIVLPLASRARRRAWSGSPTRCTATSRSRSRGCTTAW